MKRIFLILCSLSILITAVSCGSDSSDESAKESDAVVTEADSDE